MKYKRLGQSGLRVSELALGTMTFGEDWEWGSNHDESRKIFDLYAAAGGNFLDTANIYTNGTSERFVGEFIRDNRDRWVVATKYSLNNQSSDVNSSGNHRKNLFQSVEGSLKRLGTDYIDLLWLHVWDFTTPVAEVMRALDDLVRQRVVHYIGISDVPAWIVSEANTLANLRGWTPFIALQIEYSLKERTPERDLLPMAKAFDLAITPWAPLGGGLLSGKYLKEESGRLNRSEDKHFSEREMAIAKAVMDVAQEISASPSQVALKWLLLRSPAIIPILGARSVKQLEDNLGCLKISLTPEQMRKLDEVSAIALGFPHDFFKSKTVQEFAYSGTLRTIDDPQLQAHLL